MAPPKYGASTLLYGAADLFYRNASQVEESMNAAFPVANLGDRYVGTVARFPRLELGEILVGFGASRPWNAVAIANHNFEADVEFTIEKASSGSGPWTSVGTWSPTSQRCWVQYADQSSSWARLRVSDLGSQSDVPFLGELVFTYLTAFTRNHGFGVTHSRAFVNRKTRTTYRRPASSHLIAYDRVTGVMGDALTAAELAELTTAYELLAGSANPFPFMPDGDDEDLWWMAELDTDEWSAREVSAGPARYDDFALGISEIPWVPAE